MKRRLTFRGKAIPLKSKKQSKGKKKFRQIDLKKRGIKKDYSKASKLQVFLAKQTKPIIKSDQELEYFRARINTCDRMRLLEELAQVKIFNKKPYYDRLEEFNQITYKRSKKCFIIKCKNKTKARHHVILLINGGKNIARNLVTLCDKCHKKVHPWLKEDYVKRGKYTAPEVSPIDLDGGSSINKDVNISLSVAAVQLCQS